MKTLPVFLLLSVAASAQVTKSVDFSWTPSPDPVCSSTVTVACQYALTLTDITSLTPSIISSAITPGQTSYSYTFSTPGTYNYSMVVNEKDALGNAIVAPAQTTQVTVPKPYTPNPVTGFKAVAK